MAVEKAEKPEKPIGKVTHYFDKISVAVVACLKGKISVGDTLRFSHGDHQFSQTIDRIEVDHKEVDSLKKGQEAGVKVVEPVKSGYDIFPE